MFDSIMKSQWNPQTPSLLPFLLEILVLHIFSLALFNFPWICYWPFCCLVSSIFRISLQYLILCWHQYNSYHNLRYWHILIRFPNGETHSLFFYYMTFLLNLEETFSETMSENTPVVSPIVRARIIESWNCLRILVKCLILLHHKLDALPTDGGASLLNIIVSLDANFAQNQTRIYEFQKFSLGAHWIQI